MSKVKVPGREVEAGTIYDLLRVTALYRAGGRRRPAMRQLREAAKVAAADRKARRDAGSR